MAVSEYQVTLMGIPRVLKEGRLVHFPYRKAEGIFYYLCVEKATNRDELVSIFWGSSDEASGGRICARRCFSFDAAWMKRSSCFRGEMI